MRLESWQRLSEESKGTPTKEARTMKHHGIKFASPVLIAAAVGTIFWVSAGQLNPPAGSINPTGPTTLNQQDIGAGPLFSLNASGSYILTSDIVAPAAYTGDGIAIDTDNVTLNMNGFALIGVAGSQRGIRITTTFRYNISIYNGTVRDWGNDGVDAINASNSQLRNLRVYQNGGNGIVLGSGGTITGCTAYANTGNGIRSAVDANITACVARSNSGNGITGGHGSTITGCTARQNSGDGIVAFSGAAITGCAAFFSGGDGINVGFGSVVSGCAAGFSTGDGIEATDALIKGNSSTGNTGAAINDLGGSLLVDNNT